MKIIITGASGNIAKKLIPYLIKNRCELILVSRDKNKLKNKYPELISLSYNEMKSFEQHADLILHLATANNDIDNIKVHKSVNINFLDYVYRIYKKINVDHFVNISSIHALDLYNNSPYAKTKRDAALLLKNKDDSKCKTFYLPYVYENNYKHTGILKILNYLPLFIAKFIFNILKPFKRTLHIRNLNKFIINRDYISNYEDIVSDSINNNLIYIFTKKFIDITFVLFVGVFFGWMLLLIWILIKIESPGPGLFKQERIGKHNEIFICYKFRTMLVEAEEVPSHFIKESEITKLGKFLRKYKIDELPQIINILRNEISLIGPRPCLPSQDFLIKERNKYKVNLVQPGISGLSQIYGIDMSKPKDLALWDSRYNKMKSIFIDIKIIFKTIFNNIKK